MTELRELVRAIQDGDRDLVVDILEAEPDLARSTNEAGVPLALFAAYHRNRAVTDAIARRAEPLDMHSAIAMGETDTVRRALAEDPARITEPAPDGFRPLHIAAHFNEVDLVKFLIDLGAEVDQRSENSLESTPLHSAVASGAVESVQFLLEKQADPHARQVAGVTPLHLAAHRGDADVVALLLHFGADPGARTAGGRTALEMAREAGHADVVAVLGSPPPRAPL